MPSDTNKTPPETGKKDNVAGEQQDGGPPSVIESSVTPTYPGPERRTRSTDSDVYQHLTKRVVFDAKGNPVWDIRVTVPRRREDDDTVDLLKCIDPDSLSLEDEQSD